MIYPIFITSIVLYIFISCCFHFLFEIFDIIECFDIQGTTGKNVRKQKLIKNRLVMEDFFLSENKEFLVYLRKSTVGGVKPQAPNPSWHSLNPSWPTKGAIKFIDQLDNE